MRPVRTALATFAAASGLVLLCRPLPALPAAGPWTPIGPSGGSVASVALDSEDGRTVYAGTFRGGLWKSSDGGQTWARLSVPPGQTVNAVSIGPGKGRTVWAGTSGAGIWRSSDAGASWKRVQDAGNRQADVLGFAFDPSAPAVVYAHTDSQGWPNGVLKSEDAGATWKAVNEGIVENARVYALAVDPKSPRTLFAGTSEGLFRSDDGALHWKSAGAALSGKNIRSLASGDGGTWLAGTRSDGIFVSRDGGASWDAARSDVKLSGEAVYCLAADPARPRVFYAGIPNHILRSDDGGGRWSSVSSDFEWINFRGIAVDPKHADTIYAATSRDGILKSADGGRSWSSGAGLFASAVTSLLLDANGRISIGTTEGGIRFSSDGGRSWSFANDGLNSHNVIALAADPSDGAAMLAGTTAGIYRSRDAGKSWTQVAKDIVSFEVQKISFAPSDPKRVYGRTPGVVWRSDNGGAAWKEMKPDFKSNTTTLGTFALAVDPASPDVVLANSDREIFRSEDGSKSWVITSGIPATNRLQAAVIDPATKVWWGATDDGIYRSGDGGRTWSPGGKGTERVNVQTLLVDPGSPGTIYGGTWKSGILRTTDGGKTWSRIGGDAPHPDAAVLAIDRGAAAPALLVGFAGGSVWRLDLAAAGKPSAPAFADPAKKPAARKKG